MSYYFALAQEKEAPENETPKMHIFLLNVDCEDKLTVLSQKMLRLGEKDYNLVDIVDNEDYEGKRCLWESVVCKSAGKKKYVILSENSVDKRKKVMEIVVEDDKKMIPGSIIQIGEESYEVIEVKPYEDFKAAYIEWSPLFK